MIELQQLQQKKEVLGLLYGFYIFTFQKVKAYEIQEKYKEVKARIITARQQHRTFLKLKYKVTI